MNEVKVHDLALHADARGWVQPMTYEGLGYVAYVYATACYPGVVKAWHRHKLHTDRLMCVSGMARVVVARIVSGEPDMGPGSLVTSHYDVKEHVIGPLAPKVVVIPPGWWHGFTPVGNETCVVLNAPDMDYNPADEEKSELSALAFDWGDVSR